MSFFRFARDNAPYLTVGSLLVFTSSFGQTYFISVFAGDIREEFSLSHGDWGAIYAAGTVASAVVMIWAGGLTDKYRVRALGTIVLLGLALSCLLMAAVPSAAALPFVIFALRLTGQGMTSHIPRVAMARWFVKTRGRALAISGLGYAVGEAFLPLIFVALLGVFDWRTLWVVAAASILCIVPIVIRLLRSERTPQAMSESSQSAGMRSRHWRRRDAMRHWLFWAMVPIIAGLSAFGTAFFFQQVHYANVKGWSHLELVALFPIYTAAGVFSMLLSGWAIDRFGTARLMPVFQIPAILGFVVLGSTTTLTTGAIGIILLGLTFGANNTLTPAFWAEFFGTSHVGSIKALAIAIMVLGSAIGPGLTGALIDRGIDFPDQMIGIALFMLATSVIIGIAVTVAARDLPTAAQIDVIGS
ncbi:MAG: MFS transporter [Rhodobacteraceae bacterium]|nr:MFS transporter [Paracoccaceae bacterium]